MWRSVNYVTSLCVRDELPCVLVQHCVHASCHSWKYLLCYNLKTYVVWHDSLCMRSSLNRSLFQVDYIVVHAKPVNVMTVWSGGKWLDLIFMYFDAVIYVIALQFLFYIWAPVNDKICISFICRNLFSRMSSTLFRLLKYIWPVSLKR
jgi:hypothetical protein